MLVARAQARGVHYAWVVVGITFVTLLVAAGVRAAPGILIKPLEGEFGWDRASISFAIAVSILTFGLGGPVAGVLVDRFGPRRTMTSGMLLIALGLLPILLLSELWQFHLFWGLLVGIGTGAVANVLGTTIAHRWFQSYRGMIVGFLGAASSTGQLVFLPLMMALTITAGWRSAVGLLAVASLALLLPILLLMRDRPENIGLRAVGDTGAAAVTPEGTVERTPLREAVRTTDFWLLAGSFFVCGYTSNGLVGTHLIPHAIEHGFTEVAAASAVGLMGMMNIVGTLSSGWLSDRYDNRKLLAMYYGFRAMSLAALPLILEVPQLLLFAVVYGLDWIATVPPTTNLIAQRFGRASLGMLYGWVFFAHMVGAAIAAYIGGFFRGVVGDYHGVFISAALLGFIAVWMSLRIGPSGLVRAIQPRPATAIATR